jgi:biotin carboxyl carrier protein
LNFRAAAFDKERLIDVSPEGTGNAGFTKFRVRVDGGKEREAQARLEGDLLLLRLDGAVYDLWLEPPRPARPHEDYVTLRSERLRVEVRRGSGQAAGALRGPHPGRVKVTSPMPGRIVAVRVAAGQQVAKGDLLFTLEAMKMQNEFVAPVDGKIAALAATPGAVASAGDVLVELEPDVPSP